MATRPASDVFAETSKPLPPGRTGLPLLGETLPFLKDGFGFVLARAAEHGPIFRTRILGRETAVIVGPDASGAFVDPSIQRGGAMVPHVQELFGGHSLPVLDGEEHRIRKELVLHGFSHEALASYLPKIDRLVAGSFERWTAAMGEIRWLEELKRLAIESICACVMGIPPGPLTDELRAEYDAVTAGFPALPVPLPGTAHTKAKAALGRILARFEEAIHEHQRAPQDDGLSRILAARAGDGQQITVDQCKVELHHAVVAGLIVYAEMAALVLQLEQYPEVRARLAAEVRERSPEGPLDPGTLRGMPYLQRVVMETKRLCPIIPVIFGKARQDFEFAGHAVPAGWMVLWALHASHVAGPWTEPERFDPDRFSPERAEHRRHEHAFVPHGTGPATGHRCPGTDFATYLMSAFAIHLLRGHDWQLTPRQDLTYDWGKIPPEPKDGLKAQVWRTS